MDEELIEKVRKGDEQAFAELDKQYRGRVWSLCYGILLDRFAADDLTQETFSKFWFKRTKFSPDRPVWPWLKAIALRSCLDALRAVGKLRENSFEEVLEISGDLFEKKYLNAIKAECSAESSNPSGPELVAWQHMRSAFVECWGGLREDQRFVLGCVDWSDWKASWHALSEVTSKHLPAIRMSVVRAGQALVRCISTKGFRLSHSEFLALLDERNPAKEMTQ